jgi:hypothetical protein
VGDCIEAGGHQKGLSEKKVVRPERFELPTTRFEVTQTNAAGAIAFLARWFSF